MATFLFDRIVFGPVNSRRLGVSLGINLLPVNAKICNFNCVYCECGLNAKNTNISNKLPTRKEVFEALELRLKEMNQTGQKPDVITFAGNGEPTMHPKFSDIIDDTISLRNLYFPSAKISVLSNATMLHKPAIVEALHKVDQNILKLDAGIETTILDLNQPIKVIQLNLLIEQLSQFNGKLIIQSLFTKGIANGKIIDNTTEDNLLAWINCLKAIKPEMVMIYTIERDTPFDGLKKIPLSELKDIAKRADLLGIKTQISG